MNARKIRIVIADDWQIARNGLKLTLETAEEIEVVGEVQTAPETARIVAEKEPDILLMDLKWFGDETAGWTAIKQVKSRFPQVKILAITAYENLIPDARNAGADAALTKTFTREDLVQYIRNLAAEPVSFEVPKLSSPLLDELTEREKEVVNLLAKGYTYKKIAQALQIALPTVKNHVRSILEKTGAENRVEAINRAREVGLIH